ncbi:MAG: DUF2834 domain-containing protein [Saprospiraceae bacterium]
MNENIFKISVAAIGLFFTLVFCIIVVPPLIQNPDIIGALKAGFVNPYAAGYSTDTICCWLILFIWVIYESPSIKYGWICLVLGLVPGVAVGFALYLILRSGQFKNEMTSSNQKKN